MQASTQPASSAPANLGDYTVATLLGKWPLTHPWVRPCIDSWNHLLGRTARVSVISDGSLEVSDIQKAGLRDIVEFDESHEAAVERLLSPYPALLAMRKRDLTWRKLLDVPLRHRSERRLLLIDTDVLVRRPVALPDVPGIFYLREDIPAYQAGASLPWRHPLVKSFNAGFVLLDPASIDLAFLDGMARRYYLRLKNPWWSEQAAWATLAGRTPHRFYWHGADACTLSGFQTRTASEIATNKVKLISSRAAASRLDLVTLAGDAAVIHLAGLGKRNWDVLPALSGRDATMLRFFPDELLSIGWKVALSARLLAKSFRK